MCICNWIYIYIYIYIIHIYINSQIFNEFMTIAILFQVCPGWKSMNGSNVFSFFNWILPRFAGILSTFDKHWPRCAIWPSNRAIKYLYLLLKCWRTHESLSNYNVRCRGKIGSVHCANEQRMMARFCSLKLIDFQPGYHQIRQLDHVLTHNHTNFKLPRGQRCWKVDSGLLCSNKRTLSQFRELLHGRKNLSEVIKFIEDLKISCYS